jgi:hypothetical protein
MSDARDRALVRLVDMLTPAAALGVECPKCGYDGRKCRNVRLDWEDKPYVQHDVKVAFHEERVDAAREMLRADLRVLLEG